MPTYDPDRFARRSGHVRRRTLRYPQGWVAWCSCGVGSPAKATKAEAEASLAAHIVMPFELPR